MANTSYVTEGVSWRHWCWYSVDLWGLVMWPHWCSNPVIWHQPVCCRGFHHRWWCFRRHYSDSCDHEYLECFPVVRIAFYWSLGHPSFYPGVNRISELIATHERLSHVKHCCVFWWPALWCSKVKKRLNRWLRSRWRCSRLVISLKVSLWILLWFWEVRYDLSQ